MTQSKSQQTKLKNSPDEELSRLSLLAAATRAQLEEHAKSAQAPLPDGMLEGLRYLSGSLAQIQKDVERHEQERRNLQALTEIGQIVNSTLDLDQVLREVMDMVIQLTGAERSFLMLKNGPGQLRMVVARNWERANLQTGELDVSHTIVHSVLNHGEPIVTTNALDDDRFGAQDSVVKLSLRSILCVPLKLKGELTGVMYADNRVREGLFTTRERDILAAFANQAAVAIENARLYNALTEAYDQTLEALVAALDARDRETRGHSRRVVDYAVAIARQMGLSETEVANIQRGALLHDIGKIGVPDAVLLKSGPLTDQEWNSMRQHPGYARQMLTGIPFLIPAIDIVYAHQERYDGSGYPDGLAGEAIPLGARIFAVADAYDAMTSNRPYRAAQSYELARDEILSGSRSQFDPRVVEAFASIPREVWQKADSAD